MIPHFFPPLFSKPAVSAVNRALFLQVCDANPTNALKKERMAQRIHFCYWFTFSPGSKYGQHMCLSLSLCLSLALSACFCLSLSLSFSVSSISVSFCSLSLYHSLPVSVSLYIYSVSLSLLSCLSLSLTLCLSLFSLSFLSVCFCPSLSVCLSLSLSLSLFAFLCLCRFLSTSKLLLCSCLHCCLSNQCLSCKALSSYCATISSPHLFFFMSSFIPSLFTCLPSFRSSKLCFIFPSLQYTERETKWEGEGQKERVSDRERDTERPSEMERDRLLTPQ